MVRCALHSNNRAMANPQSQSDFHKDTDGPIFEAIHPPHAHHQRDTDSQRTASIDNGTARNSHDYNEKAGFSSVTGGVDVQRAEAEFAQLSKELSRTSHISRKLSRVQSRQSRKDHAPADVEKGGLAESEASSDEPFDLEKTLRGDRDEEEAAGIKSKRIGVVWDDLTVSGIGRIRTLA